VPAGLTASDFLVKLEKYQEVMKRRMQAVFDKANRDVGDRMTQEDRLNYLMLLMNRDQEGMMAETEAALGAGFNDEVLKGCIQKFSSDPRVATMMGEFQRDLKQLEENFMLRRK
jgi:hypothetical protein